MKSIIISFVAALAVGTGAATGVAMQRNKVEAAAIKAKADSLQAAKDTTHTAERVIEDPRDSLARSDSAPAAIAPATAKIADVAHAEPAAPAPVHGPAEKPAVAAADSAKSAKPQLTTLPMPTTKSQDSIIAISEKRIAKAIATMPPKDAAKVFEVMSDADVGIILASLTDKESAAILAKLPPQRVAALSRASMRKPGAAK